MVNLDLVVAVLMGMISICAFTLDCMASPRASRWMSLPSPIRWIIRITGGFFMLRSVNLVTLSQQPGPVAGQVNWLATICWFWLTISVLSLTLYALNNRLPAKAWDRISFVLRTMRRNPDTVPVMMGMGEVIELHREHGQPAVAGNDPAAVPNEAPRYIDAIRRRRQA
jgi:hypothetical protein